jgi:ribonuclease R
LKVDARSLLNLLSQQGPLGWRDLVVAMDAGSSADRRQLRNLLQGMVRSGELHQDHRGAYHPAGSGGIRRGVIESSGMTLSFQGLPLERQRRMLLRPGDEVSARVVGEEVHVLEVLARSTRPVVGITRASGRYPYVESLSPDYRGRVTLLNPEEAVDGETVAVEILGEERRSLAGRIVEHLGGEGGVAQAVVTMINAHGIPTEWEPEVEGQLSRLPKTVVPGRHQDRVNLMDIPLVTIDGATARDFDDAVFAERRRGGWRLIVAIADVAHYVKPNSALDQNASERGNSVYLPDRVIPMLPEALSNGLCSLNPRVARLAMVCDMKVSQSGKVTGFEFYEAVIRSWQRLTYERVQEFLDEGALDVEPEVCRSLTELESVFRAFREAREARGALDFDTHEAALELEDNRVKAIHPVHRLVAHQLIEEAMIAANVCAAEFIEKAFGPKQGMYRVHEPPAAEKLEQLKQALALAGVRLPHGDLTPRGLKAATDQLAGKENRWLFEMMVLRSLMQAVYTPDNKGHFGLGLARYMHFTSPIRRYADLLVHRTIKAILGGGAAPYATEALLEIGMRISATERRAESAGWAVDAWLKCEYVAPRVGETFDGIVMGVTEFGLFVELKGFYVQGLLHISELGSDYFQYQPQSLALVGERTGRRFTLGDSLSVILTDVVPEEGKLDLRLDPTRPAGSKGARPQKRDQSGKPGKRRDAGGKRRRKGERASGRKRRR